MLHSLLFIVLLVTGFIFLNKRLVQKHRKPEGNRRTFYKIAIIITHSFVWIVLSGLQTGFSEEIAGALFANKLGPAVLIMFGGWVLIFISLATSLTFSLSSASYMTSHRNVIWGFFAVLLLIGIITVMYITGDALKGFGVIGAS
jgi:hypothetical protein